MLQSCLNFLPEHAEFINERCAKVCENGRMAIHNASGVMLSYLESDDYGQRMAIGLLPCRQRKRLVVRFHCMAQPRFNKALHDLCECATLQ